MVIVHLAGGVSAVVLAGAIADRAARDQAIHGLDRLLPGLAVALAEPVRTGRQAAVDDLVRTWGEQTAIRVIVTDAAGQLIAGSGERTSVGEAAARLPEVEEALRDGRSSTIRPGTPSSGPMASSAIRIGSSESPLGVVRATIPVADERAALDRVTRMVPVVTGAVLAMSLLVLWGIARATARRIERVADGARRFTAGDLGHRVDAESSGELFPVARALNDLAAQLERRLTELQAKGAEQRAILQSMSAGMVAMDSEQRVLSVNPQAEALLEIDSAMTVRGRLVQELVRAPSLARLLEQSFDTSHPIDGDLQLGGRTVKANVEPLIDQDAGHVGTLMLLQDVTTLRRLESIRSEFAANVSHELRTPITNIKGYIETLLEDEQEGDPQSRRFLDVIGRNARRLEAIVEDLLALAGLERDGIQEDLATGRAPASRVVANVVGQFQDVAIERQIRIDTDVAPGLVLTGGAQLIEQAIANLLSNALRYSPEGTTVTIVGRHLDADWIEIAVSDEGPGIAPEHLPRLFERFYRVDQARSRNLGGTGLGLAIVKHIAAVHGGRADVTSEVGVGSRFRLVLPVEAKVDVRRRRTTANGPASGLGAGDHGLAGPSDEPSPKQVS